MAPAHLLGFAVGGVILLTNARVIFRAYDVADTIRIVSYSDRAGPRRLASAGADELVAEDTKV